MNSLLTTIVASGGAAVIAFIAGYLLRKVGAEGKVNQAESVAAKIVDDAEKDANSIIKEAKLEARDELYKSRLEFDKESKERKKELNQQEKRLIQKEENLDRKVDLLEKREKEVNRKEQSVNDKQKAYEDKTEELKTVIEKEKKELERIACLSVQDAKDMLLKRIEEEVKYDANVMIKKSEEEVKETCERSAKEIISTAIARCASDFTVETTVSVVNLPSDEMKGRIIGREGRNIRALEHATGVDVIIDDTPEAVVLSAFDPVRREIARLTLEKLIVDGRIHPARIEDVCNKTKKEMEKILKERGEAAVLETGIMGIDPKIVRLLGRLYYRTSYGQNVLKHSMEAASIMGTMAAELDLDIKLAKRIGLLHDIGKALDHEIEGSHAVIGADFAKKHGENAVVENAIRAHHRDVETQSVYAVLTEAADAISAARPGVRGETVENYIKRLEALESIANSFEGVDKAFAIQAGREVRVMVEPGAIDDIAASGVARDIAKKVQDEMDYPGQIKVTVIRETRSTEYAK